MGRHKKIGTRPPRRGTKLNPYKIGEVVRHRKTKVKCVVCEVTTEAGPVVYRVTRDDESDAHWYTAREIEVIP